MRYVIETWQNIGFYSHILGLITLIVYFVIRWWYFWKFVRRKDWF